MSATVEEKILKLILEYWILLSSSTENDASKTWSVKVSSPCSLSSSGVQIWRLPCDTYLPAPLPAVWVVCCSRGRHHKEHSRYKSHSRPDFSPPSDPLVCPLLLLHHDSWEKFWLEGVTNQLHKTRHSRIRNYVREVSCPLWLCQRCNPREAMIVMVPPTMVMMMMSEWNVIDMPDSKIVPLEVETQLRWYFGSGHPKPFFVLTACFAILDHLPWCPLSPPYDISIVWPTPSVKDGSLPTKMKKPQHCSGIFYRALTIHCDLSPQQRPICRDRLEYSIWEFQMLLLLWLLERKIQARPSWGIK